MTMTESTNLLFGGVGKGDGGCNGDGDGNSDSDGIALNNQQMLQAAMECRGGLTVEKGGLVTIMESANFPFGRVGKGDGNCDEDGDGDSNSDSDGNNNGDVNNDGNCDGGSSVGNDDGDSDKD